VKNLFIPGITIKATAIIVNKKNMFNPIPIFLTVLSVVGLPLSAIAVKSISVPEAAM